MTSAAHPVVGVLSDTHGHVPRWVLDLFTSTKVRCIIHAGDGVNPEDLALLGAIAPVTAVRGNMDGPMTARPTAVAECDNFIAYILHSLDGLDLDPVAAGVSAVICGHTHVPKVEWRQGVLYLNPGSASHPRYGNPSSCALIEVRDGTLHPRICFEGQC